MEPHAYLADRAVGLFVTPTKPSRARFIPDRASLVKDGPRDPNLSEPLAPPAGLSGGRPNHRIVDSKGDRQGASGRARLPPSPVRSQPEPEAQARVSAAMSKKRSRDQRIKVHPFSPLGQVAQELIVKGGFETVIRHQLTG